MKTLFERMAEKQTIPLREREETTFEEVAHRIREGTFYEDYDWASGPALRAIDAILTRIAKLEEALIYAAETTDDKHTSRKLFAALNRSAGR
jgi:hypothetical protein